MRPLPSSFFSVAFVATIILASACVNNSSPVPPPEVLGIKIESTNVTPGLTISMEVEAASIGLLAYSWSAVLESDPTIAAGEFTDPLSYATTWTAPYEEGTVLLSMTVGGGGGSTNFSASLSRPGAT